MRKYTFWLQWFLRFMAIVCIVTTWFKPEREIHLLIWACLMLLFSISKDTAKS